jgi:hypothetical protein
VAIGKKNDANCNGAGQCSPGPLADARNAALVANIAVAAGGALAAGGLVILLVGPRNGAGHDDHKAAQIRMVPGVGSGSIVLDGSW